MPLVTNHSTFTLLRSLTITTHNILVLGGIHLLLTSTTVRGVGNKGNTIRGIVNQADIQLYLYVWAGLVQAVHLDYTAQTEMYHLSHLV